MKRKILKIALIGFALALVFVLWRVYGPFGTRSQVGVSSLPPGAQPSKPPPPVGIFFTTSEDEAPYGNFAFRYSSYLLLAKNSIETSYQKKHHVVVVKDRFRIDPGATIEINLPGATCAIYKTCKEVDGIVIGTNSSNPEFIKLFNELATSFKTYTQPTPSSSQKP